MLSDSLSEMRKALSAGIHQEHLGGLALTLQAYEIEARNMEDRILHLTGRPHVPIMLVSSPAPAPIIEISDSGRATP